MRTKTVTLLSFKDLCTGELGLIIKGIQPTEDDPYTDNDGRLIAHDLIEHLGGHTAIGGIDDELEALGALWWVRGQHGDLDRGKPQYHSAETDLAADVEQMFWKVYETGAYLAPAPRTQSCLADDNFLEVIELADKSIISEYPFRHWDSGDQRDFAGARREYLKAVLARLRTGYRKARRKYPNSYTANTLFWEIASAVRNIHKNVVDAGQEFTLRYGDGAAVWEEADFYPED